VALLFFEPSTRTKLSFEVACRRLGSIPLDFQPEGSSMAKGETIRDTVLTVTALGAEILVIRHGEGGVPEASHHWSGVPVINAGDGTNEHPTQALADLLTLREHFGQVQGLEVAVVGDVAHSRVAGSLIPALTTMGADVTIVAPPLLVPAVAPVSVTHDLGEVIETADVIYLLRVQRERGAEIGADYVDRYQVGPDHARKMRSGSVIMHPGPVNRGVEVTDDVIDGPRSLVREQVANGVPVRMAVLEAIARRLG
jgi:aspartate carbamoyltransferase catalytic subunit